MNIQLELLECLRNSGVIVDNSDWNEPLSEIFPDSISYVSAVVEIESHFNIALPDVFFSSIDECSLTSLENAILSLISGTGSES